MEARESGRVYSGEVEGYDDDGVCELKSFYIGKGMLGGVKGWVGRL